MNKIDIALKLGLFAILFYFAYLLRIDLQAITDSYIKEAIKDTIWFGIICVILNNTNK